TAVLHSGSHIEPEKTVGVLLTQFLGDILVIVHRVHGRDGGIAPAVPHNELSSAFFEAFEIGIRSIEDLRRLLVGGLHVAVKIKPAESPSGVLVHHVGEEPRAERVLEALAGRRPRDPWHPAAGPGFPARRITGENLLSTLVAWAGVDSRQRRYLRLSEAGV